MNARLPPIAQDPAVPVSPPRPARTARPLVSVRNVEEALLVAQAGVMLIDLKEPRDGALGGLPPATVKQVVEALRAQGFAGEISATIGDHAATALGEISSRIDALAATGVDVVKVGVAPDPQGTGASRALVDMLAARAARGLKLVPVLIADQGLGVLPVAEALARPFHAVMLDTEDKAGGAFAGTPGSAGAEGLRGPGAPGRATLRIGRRAAPARLARPGGFGTRGLLRFPQCGVPSWPCGLARSGIAG